MKQQLRARLADLPTLIEEPTARIDLMHGATASNEPFYGLIVREFFRASRAPHPKMPIIRQFARGVALCRLPDSYAQYFMQVEGSARRNAKKADRAGYRVEGIDFNRHLADIGQIRRSASVRQGPMPATLLDRDPNPITDPPSRSNVHDYPWFGVLCGDKLVAYASCFVAGEVCLLNQIFGHADHQEQGVVPRLILGVAEQIYARYPRVKFYGYDTYFGASPTLRRFKRKMGFEPYNVRWELDSAREEASPSRGPESEAPASKIELNVPAQIRHQLVYRRRSTGPEVEDPVPGTSFHYLENPAAIALVLGPMRRHFGAGLVKVAAKLATPTRHYYCLVQDGVIVSDGWVMLDRCARYLIGRGDAVIGPTWTDPEQRGKGLCRFGLRAALNALYARGVSVTWIDTSRDNVPMQKVIARCGYGAPVASLLRR